MRQDLPIEVKSCRGVVGDADPYAVTQKKKAPAVAGALRLSKWFFVGAIIDRPYGINNYSP